jgi:hypothetical protein
MHGKSDSGCFEGLQSYFIYKKESGTHWIGGCMEPTANLIGVEKENSSFMTPAEHHHEVRLQSGSFRSQHSHCPNSFSSGHISHHLAVR